MNSEMDKSYHFETDQIVRALEDSGSTAYMIRHIKAALNSMTSGERYTLYGAIRKLLLASEPEDPMDTQTIRERDEAEERLTELAQAVGEFFDVPVGEHSSSNDPATVAFEILGGGYVYGPRASVVDKPGQRPPALHKEL